MASSQSLMDRARDELFSHINRCGVLQASIEDQRHWMDETIEYLGERYPDLTDADLRDLHAVGIRFCQPAIRNVGAAAGAAVGSPFIRNPENEEEAVAEESTA